MKQRLIELINAKQDAGIYETPGFQPTGCTSNEELAAHLIANGVVAPPIKIGDTVWAISNNAWRMSLEKVTITEIYFVYRASGVSFTLVTDNVLAHAYEDHEVGVSIFFTEEEAKEEYDKRVRIVESREFCYRQKKKGKL